MKCALPFALVLALSGAVAAQDEEHCLNIFDDTQFCGRDLGWVLMEPQPFPGMLTFANQEFTFGVSHQGAHGKTINTVLYDDTIRSLLAEMDRRMDQAPGTHQPVFDEDVEKEGVRGRRIGVISEMDETTMTFFMDFYYSDHNGWVAQTAHIGPIELDRMLRTHGNAIGELFIDP